jgi:DNA-binding transcriptional ArsR family regulator
MLFKSAILEKIRAGGVTLAFRRWRKPSVRAGGSLRTAVGVLAIDRVRRVDPEAISDEDAKRAGYASRRALISELENGREGAVYEIALRWSREDPRVALRDAEEIGAGELESLVRQLAALDAQSRAGDWTGNVLQLIGSREGITAGEIAERLGMEKLALKQKIRRLKELGLTESLRSGYRLSRRGTVLLDLLSGRTSSKT